MTVNQDPYTTASAAPENAAADYPDLPSVEDVREKIFRQSKTGRLDAHIQAIRLVNSVQ